MPLAAGLQDVQFGRNLVAKSCMFSGGRKPISNCSVDIMKHSPTEDGQADSYSLVAHRRRSWGTLSIGDFRRAVQGEVVGIYSAIIEDIAIALDIIMAPPLPEEYNARIRACYTPCRPSRTEVSSTFKGMLVRMLTSSAVIRQYTRQML